jgi:aryl-alcohol dehydrogenase-like predicted oxidoreductase
MSDADSSIVPRSGTPGQENERRNSNSLALQFSLREPRFHDNPIGSLNIVQLEANVRAASTPLPEDVWRQFEERFPESSPRHS